MDFDRATAYAVRQLLTEPRGTLGLDALAAYLCGFQDQIPGTALKSAVARSAAVAPDDLRRLLYDDRQLVRTWTVRGTIHVIAAADLPLFRYALRPEWETRWSAFLDNHSTAEQRREAGEAALAALADGPATRAELLARVSMRLGESGPWLDYLFSGWGGVLKDLAYRGWILHGPPRGSESQFVLTDDWLPGCGDEAMAREEEPDNALARLLVRYLAAHGPASLADFSYWSGVAAARAKRALAIAGEAVLRLDRDEGGRALHDAAIRPDGVGESTSEVNLLPKFDPYLLAHKDKFYLDPAHYKKVFGAAGQVAAVVVIDGRVVGTWRREEAERQEGRATVSPFEELSMEEREAITRIASLQSPTKPR